MVALAAPFFPHSGILVQQLPSVLQHAPVHGALIRDLARVGIEALVRVRCAGLGKMTRLCLRVASWLRASERRRPRWLGADHNRQFLLVKNMLMILTYALIRPASGFDDVDVEVDVRKKVKELIYICDLTLSNSTV